MNWGLCCLAKVVIGVSAASNKLVPAFLYKWQVWSIISRIGGADLEHVVVGLPVADIVGNIWRVTLLTFILWVHGVFRNYNWLHLLNTEVVHEFLQRLRLLSLHVEHCNLTG